ncbi:MAG: ATP-binding protein [Planctomycetota bacterium]|nr:ATP-binding protein [Planctomycetota bacterium]
MASLFVIQGHDRGRRYELEDDLVTLGREGFNRIQLHDTEASRRHVELHRTEGSYRLVDLGSSNCTFVNNNQVQEHLLVNGDRVEIGCTRMIFTIAGDVPVEKQEPDVDIVAPESTVGASRIVSSLSQAEGSQLFQGGDSTESDWLARARSNLQVMYRTALAVSHTLDIDQLLTRIMELIFEWVEADRGCIMLMDSDTSLLAPATRMNRREGQADEKMAISQTILDYVIENDEGVLTTDAREDNRFDAAGSIVKMGVREAICVPMQGRYGVVGVIYIDTYTTPGKMITQQAPNRFTEEHLKLMIAIGHQAALAIEDTSYYSAMVQAERLAAIGQTIAILSHDIKNILQGIAGGSYLIEEGLGSQQWEVIEDGWRIVAKNQEKISHLAMDMLSFSKERKPELAAADLNQVVADVEEVLRTRAQEAGVRLQVNAQEGIPSLLLDVQGIHRACLNVVGNAIEACAEQEGGNVTVVTEIDPAQQQTRIIVKDNGPGIPEAELQAVFSLFRSAKGNQGTGLGLPVSQKILREHGGDVLVESVLGKGSCFILQWPLNPVSTDGGGDTQAS